MKIQIIGYSGSGKSTLAKQLGEIFNIPVLHLDNTRFYGDWQERDLDEQRAIVKIFLNNNTSWVIDGNYSSVVPERYEQSDITIFLNYNRFYCYKKAKERYKKYRGTHRESCPCEEKFDFAFQYWILFKGRTRKRQKQHINNLNKSSGQKLIFNNLKQLNNWLKSLKKSNI